MASADSMIRRFKFKASRLMKNLSSEEDSESYSAAQRFSALDTYSGMSVDDILEKRRKIKHRHALEVVAIEAGFESWKQLLDHHDTIWYPNNNPMIEDWFDTYREAKECREKNGGYLLTCKGRYFIACAEYIELLGLDPDDRLWQRIGFDCKKPSDKKSFRELIDKLRSASGSFA